MGLDNNIPEGWKVTNLESCLSSLIDYRGKTPKKSKSRELYTDNEDIGFC